MENISAETINEMLEKHPELTVEELISELKGKWISEIDEIFEREVQLVIREYEKTASILLNEDK